jgi:hypothetical protein
MKIKYDGDSWEVVRVPISEGYNGLGIWRLVRPEATHEIASNCSLQEFLAGLTPKEDKTNDALEPEKQRT